MGADLLPCSAAAAVWEPALCVFNVLGNIITLPGFQFKMA